ncbi:diguanylate cyclase [Sulfurimonas sp. SAG-AH-194-I05]|nr:diguanylate cyclase [Sulfurimonas sp. SAG-AH-194-I05]MDF1874457.1 diguanylate cyclase [Sulfurimonas sp. SAG-AH-194-I05]
MQFIEALKLKSKLFFLFILITLGLVSVGIMGTMNVESMKKNLDSVYFGSLVPVTELNEMLQVYHGGLASILYKAKSSEVNRDKTSAKIELSLNKINKIWNSYKSHFKRDNELDYIEYVNIEIKNVNYYFVTMLRYVRKNNNLEELSIVSLEKNVSHIHTVLQKLITYEVDMAKYERKVFLSKYEKAMFRLTVVLGLIILAVLIISYSVFRSIQSDHTKLEEASKKLKKLNKKLENVSYTDSLTSMHNRRYFNLVYERELKRAKRTHSYITFMMLDIDFFKQYNDTYGHLEGDNTLKSVAKVLKEVLQRPSDFVFRLGGEEFGVLLTQTDESSSAKMARDICDAVRDIKIAHSASKANEFVTISIGVVCCIADDALNEDLLLSRADEMLYEAKDTGRDRYIITSNVNENTVGSIDELTAS